MASIDEWMLWMDILPTSRIIILEIGRISIHNIDLNPAFGVAALNVSTEALCHSVNNITELMQNACRQNFLY